MKRKKKKKKKTQGGDNQAIIHHDVAIEISLRGKGRPLCFVACLIILPPYSPGYFQS